MGRVQARGLDVHVLGDHRQGDRRAILADGPTAGKSTEQGGPSAGVARLLGVGCGEYDPVTGLYEWYEGGIPAPKQGRARQGAPELTWDRLLAQWPLIEADLHSEYGIDVEDGRAEGNGILQRRTWRWLQIRILGLLSAETRLHRHFAPPPEDPQHAPRRRR